MGGQNSPVAEVVPDGAPVPGESLQPSAVVFSDGHISRSGLFSAAHIGDTGSRAGLPIARGSELTESGVSGDGDDARSRGGAEMSRTATADAEPAVDRLGSGLPIVEFPDSTIAFGEVASWVREIKDGGGDGEQSVGPPIDRARSVNCGQTTLAVFDQLSGIREFPYRGAGFHDGF